MRQLIAVILDHDVDAVTKVLLQEGVLHFIKITQVDREWSSMISEATPAIQVSRVAEIRKRVEALLELSGISIETTKELELSNLKPVNLEKISRNLDALSNRVQALQEKEKELEAEILKLEDLGYQVELFGDISTAFQAQSRYSFLNIQSGHLQNSRYEGFSAALAGFPSVLLELQKEETGNFLLLISMKRDEGAVGKILDQYGWVESEEPGKLHGLRDDVVQDLDSRIAKLKKDLESIQQEVYGIITEKQDTLEMMWQNLRMNELYSKTQSYFGKTARTFLFSGWLPASKQNYLDMHLRKATQGRCFLDWRNAEEKENGLAVPVEFKNPKLLAPFQMLVTNYGIPEYDSINPTPFVALAYLVMFGLMFGDAGHGMVLALLGMLGSFLFKKKSENLQNLLKLIIWCGGAAIVAGMLFGSYFGLPLLKPLWFDYHGAVSGHASSSGVVKDIYGILVITIYFGICVIGIGLVINWINLAAKRKWLPLFLDKGGIVGGWMYGAGAYSAFYFAGNDFKELPSAQTLFWLLGVPALLFLMKPPLEFALKSTRHRGEKFRPFKIADFLMEWIVELLEIFSGYLANTLSFMRVAGLGIAHVTLMNAFFEIARMAGGTSGSRYSLWSYIILILGNILVIGLEGLSAGIQSLRLNYYEFFSKYFSGKGMPYSPISLRRKRNE